jgi:hypothetical protein
LRYHPYRGIFGCRCHWKAGTHHQPDHYHNHDVPCKLECLFHFLSSLLWF